MKRTFPCSPIRTAIAALTCALAVASGAHAQPRTSTSDENALQAAQAELERAAERVAELSRKMGRPERGPIVIERRIMRKPVLGVVLVPSAEHGVQIGGVTPGSGAEQAGLRSGDRILSIDGEPITGANEQARLERARAALVRLDPRTPVSVEYERAGQRSTTKVTPSIGERAVIMPDIPGLQLGGPIRVMEGPDGEIEIQADSVTMQTPEGTAAKRRIIRHGVRGPGGGRIEDVELPGPPSVAPGIHREIIRLGPGGGCRGHHCEMPLIAEALRWNGLNLASVDAQLGRYFGTDRGVLVLSAPHSDFGGLQPGDVIRTIDGKPVATPREAMSALRGRPAGNTVMIGYLRDRREATTQVRVPDVPPVGVAPPGPPAPAAAPAPTAPGAPLSPPAPPHSGSAVTDAI